ncbi:MAG: F0F1 ATP synthase subunit gamma [Peptococcaceae bacterium]|nr:F0F1 ATP synthase subunit gamma [Peptococcaceae bacterium]
MSSLRDLRRRVKSIKSTQQITKAMKAVSAAKMRKAQEFSLAARPYAKKLAGVLGRVASVTKEVKHPLLNVREPKKVVFLVITADGGLCGGFNSNTIRYAVSNMKDMPEVSMVCVGRKSRDFFRKRDYNILEQYVGLGDNIGIAQAREIAQFIIDKYSSTEVDAVYLVYSEFVNVLIQRPTMLKLLPAEPPQEGDAQKCEFKVDYIFEPSPEEVMNTILPKYITNSIYQGLLETKAGLYSARMTAMDNATKNAADMIDSLTLSINKARQAAITTEISEIVGGAAALE